jgi:hypothetical protein
MRSYLLFSVTDINLELQLLEPNYCCEGGIFTAVAKVRRGSLFTSCEYQKTTMISRVLTGCETILLKIKM